MQYQLYPNNKPNNNPNNKPSNKPSNKPNNMPNIYNIHRQPIKKKPINIKLINNIIDNNINRIFNKTYFLLQTYSTPIHNLLANPFKKTISYIVLIIILVLILKYFNLLRYLIRLDYLYIYYILLPCIGFLIFINQYKTNNNIIALYYKGILNENSTVYEYNKVKIYDKTFINIFWSTLLSILISDFVIFNFTMPFKDAPVEYLNNFKNLKNIKNKSQKIISSIRGI